MTDGLTIGSLFSGIGGLELGLEAALGARVVWQVERDAYCRRVLARHWPDADRSVTDVREAGAATLAPVDVVCGGFPCQDISVAGNGEGLDGARSGLWWEMARVLREMGPSYVVLENVPALANRGLPAVLGELASQGYDAEWGVLSAESVGAPHLRRRLFVVAWRPDADGQGPVQQEGPERAQRRRAGDVGGEVPDPECFKLRQQPGRCGGTNGASAAVASVDGEAWAMADTMRAGREEQHAPAQPGWARLGAGRAASLRRDWWAAEPDVVPARVDRLRALGNAVVPAVAFEIGLILRELMG